MERSDTKEASLVIALFNSLRELPDDDAGKRNHSWESGDDAGRIRAGKGTWRPSALGVQRKDPGLLWALVYLSMKSHLMLMDELLEIR